jgi:hypothetical protein
MRIYHEREVAMKVRRFRPAVIAGITVLAFISNTGCEEATSPEQQQVQQDKSNPNSPNANNAIVYEHVFGDRAKRNSIWMVDDDGAGGYYFAGLIDSYYSFGRIGPKGAAQWSERVSYNPRDIKVLTASMTPAFSGFLGVGGRDVDGSGGSDYGYVGLFNSTGTLADELMFSSTDGDVWLNSIEHLADTTFVVAGGREIASTEYPFLARISVSSDGLLIKHEEATGSSLPDVYFSELLRMDPSQTGPTTDFLAVGRRTPGGGAGRITVHRFTVDTHSLNPVTMAWTQEIVVYAGLETHAYTGKSAVFDGQHLYVAGSTEHAKEPRPSGGGYWRAGLVASVSLVGDVEWTRVVNLSEYSDELVSAFLAQDGLYAVGAYSRFHNNPTDRNFGYGLLSKLDPSTGSVLANMTFGDASYSSGLNTVVVKPGVARSTGWKNFRESSSGMYCWYAEIDVSGTSRLAIPGGEVATKDAKRLNVHESGKPVEHRQRGIR